MAHTKSSYNAKGIQRFFSKTISYYGDEVIKINNAIMSGIFDKTSNHEIHLMLALIKQLQKHCLNTDN